MKSNESNFMALFSYNFILHYIVENLLKYNIGLVIFFKSPFDCIRFIFNCRKSIIKNSITNLRGRENWTN